jgi:hypothetical protein
MEDHVRHRFRVGVDDGVEVVRVSHSRLLFVITAVVGRGRTRVRWYSRIKDL